MEKKITELELIPKSTAEKLDAHIKIIHTFIAGHNKGAAEQFGYAFLAGRRLLEAKEDLPHGNSDSSGGFLKWVEANLPEITRRTATNWMVFAESVTARVQIDSPRSPLLLDTKKLNVKQRHSILRLVPDVMDGKGMMRFMRDSRLLRDPEKPKHHARKDATAQEANKAKAKQAARLWTDLRERLDTGGKILKWLNGDDIKMNVDALVEAANKNREALKRINAQ